MNSNRGRLSRVLGENPLERRLRLIMSGLTFSILMISFLILNFCLRASIVELHDDLVAAPGADTAAVLAETINQTRAALVATAIVVAFLFLVIRILLRIQGINSTD